MILEHRKGFRGASDSFIGVLAAKKILVVSREAKAVFAVRTSIAKQ